MGRRLIPNWEKETWFNYWCQNHSYQEVSKKYGIPKKTICKAAADFNWEKRKKRIVEEAQIIADAKSGRRLARNLEILKFLKEKIVEKVNDDETKGNVSDVPNLIKTEELLVGNPDSRPEIINRDPEEIKRNVERLAESFGLRISFNGIGPNRISPALVSSNPPPEHQGGET